MSATKLFRCSVLALASAGMLALPSAASAHETGDHAPVTANCPPGGAIQNAVCFALRGVEYSVRHGGTVQAAQELRSETEGNAGTYRTQTVANVGAFVSSIDIAVPQLLDDTEDGVDNGLLKSDLYGAGLIQSVEAALLAPFPVPPCPLNDVNPGVFQNTVQALKVLFCAQWAAIIGTLPGDLTPLANHIDQLVPTLIAIEEPLAQAVDAFGGAVAAASTTLAIATDAATQALGANQVFDTFYAAQCVRRGDYGPFTRPTACPPS